MPIIAPPPAASCPGSRRADAGARQNARRAWLAAGALAAALLAGVAAPPAARAAATGDDLLPDLDHPVLRGIEIDSAVEDRLLALDPERISEADVREVLARAPAPHIMLLHGSVPVLTMRPFAQFLIDMGYPKDRLVNPRDGAMSYSSYTRGREIAGTLAWHYEREGMVPLMIGHSQGGVAIVSALLELSGKFADQIPVWDPVRDQALDRTMIVDPVTGAWRSVVGLTVPYAAALATGKLMRLFLGQWDMIDRLRDIPDSVDEFSGYLVPGDILTASWLTGPKLDAYRPLGTATVRNVTLPDDYHHVTLPLVRHLAKQPITRDWINAYHPDDPTPAPPTAPDVDTSNIVHAADIWFSIKKHWCLEAQRLVRARRALVAMRE
jgi:hypothetical protein